MRRAVRPLFLPFPLLLLVLLLAGCARATRHFAANVQPGASRTEILVGNVAASVRSRYGGRLERIGPPTVEKMSSRLALTEATAERACFFLERYLKMDPAQTRAENPYAKRVAFELDTSDGVVGKRPALGEIRAEVVDVKIEYLYSETPPVPTVAVERYNHSSLTVCFTGPRPLVRPGTRWLQLMVRGWDTEIFRFNLAPP